MAEREGFEPPLSNQLTDLEKFADFGYKFKRLSSGVGQVSIASIRFVPR